MPPLKTRLQRTQSDQNEQQKGEEKKKGKKKGGWGGGERITGVTVNKTVKHCNNRDRCLNLTVRSTVKRMDTHTERRKMERE